MLLATPLLLALAPQAPAQKTWYVDDDACPGAGLGTAEQPFCALQSAVQAAASGDRVLVQPGSYDRIDFAGKDLAVVAVEGPGATEITSSNILALVVFGAGETRAASLEGFTVRGGSSHAVLIDGASPTLRGNVIRDNVGGDGGSGVRIQGGAAPLLVENDISNNTCWPGTGDGGGLYVVGSSARLERNRITGNFLFADFGGSAGAGLYARGANLELIGNLFLDNTAADEASNQGGGVYCETSTLLAVGNTFRGNLALRGQPFPPFTEGAPGQGGALALRNSQATLVNNLLWDDVAGEGPELSLVGGTTALSWSDVEGGRELVHGGGAVVWGPGMQQVDPQLDADQRLSPTSPLVDAGSPESPPDGLDVDREPRVLDGDLDGALRVDVGWDEYDPTTLAVGGAASPGGTLNFVTTAPAGWRYLLAWSTGVGQVRVASFGSVLLNPARLMVFAAGSVPGDDDVGVPNDPAVAGLVVHVQALARDPTALVGSFSRRVTLVVR